ncbi:hypothetical protein [Candidatus Tisiphia endosymbiont of Parasteatoda lunata]
MFRITARLLSYFKGFCSSPEVNHSALQVQSLILRHECLIYVLT